MGRARAIDVGPVGVDHYRSPLLGQEERDSPADASAGARDDGYLAVQAVSHDCTSVFYSVDTLALVTGETVSTGP